MNTGVTAEHRQGSVSTAAADPGTQKIASNKRNRHDAAGSHRRATMRTGISDPNVNMVPTKT